MVLFTHKHKTGLMLHARYLFYTLLNKFRGSSEYSRLSGLDSDRVVLLSWSCDATTGKEQLKYQYSLSVETVFSWPLQEYGS